MYVYFVDMYTLYCFTTGLIYKRGDRAWLCKLIVYFACSVAFSFHLPEIAVVLSKSIR